MKIMQTMKAFCEIFESLKLTMKTMKTMKTRKKICYPSCL